MEATITTTAWDMVQENSTPEELLAISTLLEEQDLALTPVMWGRQPVLGVEHAWDICFVLMPTGFENEGWCVGHTNDHFPRTLLEAIRMGLESLDLL